MKDVCAKMFLSIHFLNFYYIQIMSYLGQKCKKNMGVTDFVSKIKRVENYSGARNSVWSAGVYS